MSTLREYSVSLLLVLGALFVALAAIGILRMPDLYQRLHAASKAATLGVAFLGYALVLHFNDWSIGFRAIAFGLFLFLTAPISTHLIARAAFVIRAEEQARRRRAPASPGPELPQ